ncbi:hypothetical protein GJ496_004151 [Pomphorhynchus laevis]|nr:hypothetical protein GJ496_004151 [Pomphorhynchus laevis]
MRIASSQTTSYRPHKKRAMRKRLNGILWRGILQALKNRNLALSKVEDVLTESGVENEEDSITVENQEQTHCSGQGTEIVFDNDVDNNLNISLYDTYDIQITTQETFTNSPVLRRYERIRRIPVRYRD